MASWIIHFRVAQALLDGEALPFPRTETAETAFVMGNIAPDSGVPAENGHGYRPAKHLSHFHAPRDPAQSYLVCDTQNFADQYLTPPPKDAAARAFYLGYLAHLCTDNRWVQAIVLPAGRLLSDGSPNGETAGIERAKADWYDMDFMYIKRHPAFPAYRLYAEAPPFRNIYIDFFEKDAFEARKSFILDFYRDGAARVTERQTYLSEEDLEIFVRDTAREIAETWAESLQRI